MGSVVQQQLGTLRLLAATLLHMTPALRNTPDGYIKAGGVLFGKQDFVEKFARFVLRRLDLTRTWRISVGHCHCRADGERLLQLLRDAIPKLDNAWLLDVGSALGVHAGPGALVVGVQDYGPPNGTAAV